MIEVFQIDADTVDVVVPFCVQDGIKKKHFLIDVRFWYESEVVDVEKRLSDCDITFDMDGSAVKLAIINYLPLVSSPYGRVKEVLDSRQKKAA